MFVYWFNCAGFGKIDKKICSLIKIKITEFYSSQENSDQLKDLKFSKSRSILTGTDSDLKTTISRSILTLIDLDQLL